MASPHNPNQNRVLAAFSAEESARLTPYLELVPMPLGEVYYESGGRLPYIYFPTTAIVSLHSVMKHGASAEIAVVGSDGALGISLFMDGNNTPSRATVCIAGYGYRLKTQLLMEEFNRGGPLQRLLLRYSQALNSRAAQTAECNWHHTLSQQLCRWLLLTLERTGSNEINVTHESLAGILGVNLEDMAEATKKLQQAGLIRSRRSHITVIDRAGLKDRSCECYEIIRTSIESLTEARTPKNSAAAILHNSNAILYARRVNCIPRMLKQRDRHTRQQPPY